MERRRHAECRRLKTLVRSFAAPLIGLALATVPAAAQEAPPDTVPPTVVPAEPIPLDTLAFGLAPADTVPVLGPRFRQGEAARRLAAVPSEDLLPKNPRNAAIRAFLLPGWGQWYTGHPWRAIVFGAAEVGFLWAGYDKQRESLALKSRLGRARRAFFADPPAGVDPDDPIALLEAFQQTERAITLQARLDDAENRREDFYAYGAFSVIFAAIDAYVSAQLDPIEVGVDPAARRTWAGVRLPAP